MRVWSKNLFAYSLRGSRAKSILSDLDHRMSGSVPKEDKYIRVSHERRFAEKIPCDAAKNQP